MNNEIENGNATDQVKAGYEWLLPVCLTSLLFVMLCASYSINRLDYHWLSDLLQPKNAGDAGAARITSEANFISWMTVTGLYVIACVTALFIGLHVIWTTFAAPRRMKWTIGGVAVAVVAAIAFYVAQNYSGRAALDGRDIFSQLMNATLSEHGGAISAHLILDSIGIGIAMLLAVASSVIVKKSDNGSEDKSGRQGKQLRYVLYVGSALLVVAVLRVSALLHWALAAIKTNQTTAIYESMSGLISSNVTLVGSIYTLFLAAVYLPAAFILNKNIDDDADKKRLPIAEQFFRVAAILAPLLAGSVGEVLGRLK